MNDDVKKVEEQAVEDLNKVSNSNELMEIKNKYLSKKGIISSLMVKMKDFAVEQKVVFGKEVNDAKEKITTLIEEKRRKIEEKEIEERLKKERIDLTMPGEDFSKGSKHPITIVNELITDIFVGMGYTVKEGPEVEEDLYNFEMLNLPKDHPAREMQDTFYIDEKRLLRTHTSPVQVRTMLALKGKGPIKIICPGKTYRKDDDDATHSHQFNQMEGLVIDKDVTMSDLKGTLELFSKKMFGEDRKVKFRSSFFPFTEPSVEVDVSCGKCGGKGCSMCKGTGWIEVLGAGMVHPNVLEMCGFDPKVYQGFAFGFGIDRVTLLKYGIDDIRLLYSNDLRFLNQFGKEN